MNRAGRGRAEETRGRLVLCATPIGNLEDVSARALRALGEADVVACEDTRTTRKLFAHFAIKAKELVSYHEGNEKRQAPALRARIERGEVVVLVSDAGMPGLSDPGYLLVRACIDGGLDVEVVPGPSAAISALVVSGLPPARFVFEGFLPKKSGERRRRISELGGEERTILLYESPHRITSTLQDLADLLGARPAALVRELTKMHEEVRRGTLPELAQQAEADPPRGEIVVVIGGAEEKEAPEVTGEELARRARALMEAGMDRKEALGEVARAAGVPRRAVFDALVEE
jgi:16S rRNA (cytidine1402-2'-O)-methyltransferase